MGNTVQFVTNGLKIGDYLPDDSTEEVDILVRFPEEHRDIGRFDELRVKTPAGLVPITNFAQITPEPKQDTINRLDGIRIISVQADMAEGYNLAVELQGLLNSLMVLRYRAVLSSRSKGKTKSRRILLSFCKVHLWSR
ncbi:RND multidrug efflux transporter [Vibrio maritimus]|uniref:RND multidrug efflux transporter n=1 Tax=Vibrio maritimus TaxID=990268 RepID=A0A090S1K8_9VIBR|nr:RND multidrug efflux transporter [Vibrio maritimus]